MVLRRIWVVLIAAGCANDLAPVAIDEVESGHEVAIEEPLAPEDPHEMDPVPDAPYPVVLAHGFLGFDRFAGLDFAAYFFDVQTSLAEAGENEVFTPAVDPFNDSDVRGMQLLRAVEAIVADTGAAKVNIIGHSQGGLDARLVASLRPELVESVTTISTPHLGNVLSDWTSTAVPPSDLDAIIDGLVQLVGAPLWDEIGNETSVMRSIRQLSTESTTAFTMRYPDSESVTYYSIAGRSDWHLGAGDCQVDDAPLFIRAFEGERDPIDEYLSPFEAVLDGGFGRYPNDGLVRVESTRWGRFLGCIPADHLDQIGQVVGDSPGFLNEWDYRAFYRDLVAWLRAQGH